MAGQARRRTDEADEQAAAALSQVLSDVRAIASVTVGVREWTGAWRGRTAQVRTIVDTLAVRKLPAVWLSVTIAEPLAVPGRLDVMLRPAGPTTFSSFDDLPETLPTPVGWPLAAVARCDSRAMLPSLAALAERLSPAQEPRLKELLVTPNGVRATALLAEADRVRYGVFRQAKFDGRERIEPELVRRLLAILEIMLDTLAARAAA